MSFASELAELAEPFEERAGIMEFMGGLSREEAEEEARQDVEKHRHACEARAVAGMESNAARAEFLRDVAKRRGEEAAERLRRDAWEILRKGK